MTKPEIEFQEGPAPAELVIKDIIEGDGKEAVPGGTVEVHYVGVEFDSGEEFDSSWSRGESLTFPLRGLIEGWQEGIPGWIAHWREMHSEPLKIGRPRQIYTGYGARDYGEIAGR